MRSVVSVFGVDPKRIGSNERFARELSTQLGQAGYASVLCFDGIAPQEVRQYLDLPNVRMEHLPGPGRIAWAPLRKLAGVLRAHRPQVVHLHYTGLLSPYPWLARTYGVRRVFVTDHTSSPEREVLRVPGRFKLAAARTINLPVSSVISVSEFGRRRLLGSRVVPAAKSVLIYNGVDLKLRARCAVSAASTFRTKYGIPSERRIVLQVSWMIPEKGVTDLLQAAVSVLQARSDVQFVFVGEGHHLPAFKRAAEESGIAEHVTWTGLLVDPSAEGAYAAADIVCQPSRWQELFGWTITEAMVWQKPVIGTRAGGIPELVVDGETGLLVDPGDVGGLAQSILRLLAAPALRDALGRRASCRAAEKFDLGQNVSRLLELYFGH